MMKKTVTVFILVFMTLLLCSCAQNTNEAAAKEFLTNFYTVADPAALSDSLDQYLSGLESAENPAQLTQEYHSFFADKMTSTGFEKFISNRYLLNLQKAAVDTNSTLKPSDITLSENGGTYNFSTVVTIVRSNEYSMTQSGQITFSEDGLIDSVFFANLSDLTDN